MTTETEAFSNPTAPVDAVDDVLVSKKKLSNSDFRTILMTPRAGKEESKNNQTSMQPPKKADHDKKKIRKHKPPKPNESPNDKGSHRSTPTPYRDRARERREGKAVVETAETPGENVTSGQYKAVSGRKSDNIAQAENRRQLIEESKFLGGDLKHTHLVKGLDFVLLEKARHNIDSKQKEAIVKAEKTKLPDGRKGNSEEIKETIDDEFRTPMCKKLFHVLFEKTPTQLNPNFYPGRMAYRIDLDDDFAEFDVPTTIHRSIMDCGRVEDHIGLVSSNQMVISSLTNILSYHRGEKKQAKKAKLKDKVGEREVKDPVGKEFDMFGGLPEGESKKHREDRHRKSHTERHSDNHASDRKHSDREKKSRYFEKPAEEIVTHNPMEKMKMLIKNMEKRNGDKKSHEENLLKYMRKKTSTTGYEECYPELMESQDAMGDSDDEADYTKMDMGNKKGPVGRWDFENQDEYSKYMSSKEAMPKAAFQYGVKMADGRKTRRIHGGGGKDEKAALDKEWKQIQDVWKNRGGDGQPPEKKTKT